MKRQILAILVILVQSISIEAFHYVVRNTVTTVDTVRNKCAILSSKSSKYNNHEFILDRKIMKHSFWRLQQAADAWTGGGSTSDASPSRLASGGGYGNIEQMEYKIYPDGRVEELVRGIKGNNCHKVTQSIHEQLGEVIATQPTEELYEQEVQVSQTLYNTDSTSGGGDWSSSSW
jgi:Protein of unknown function (DUF2997)